MGRGTQATDLHQLVQKHQDQADVRVFVGEGQQEHVVVLATRKDTVHPSVLVGHLLLAAAHTLMYMYVTPSSV